MRDALAAADAADAASTLDLASAPTEAQIRATRSANDAVYAGDVAYAAAVVDADTSDLSVEDLGAKMRAELAVVDARGAYTNCDYCDAPNAKRCSRCRKARFCNRVCQRAMWGTHKLVCVIDNAASAIARAERIVPRADEPKVHAGLATMALLAGSGTQLCNKCGLHVQTMTKCTVDYSYHIFSKK